MNLKTARKIKGMTQEQLASQSGVDQTTISAIECGKSRNPSWETVSRIANTLGVAPEEIFPVGNKPAA
jgi:transcriptional regulator with XRE-family HTH domain